MVGSVCGPEEDTMMDLNGVWSPGHFRWLCVMCDTMAR